ncbi:hypothetical protein K7X08_016025 [Anisodus acutangulus]|uniref:Uncharacterized protein n=1 Tax=Anisodus acutangulus TaxID=402998 RepID=A0A9Q1QXM3_9SOLA|nr:hypothetical protein K7X08_016025 [Anisodus acutangulus]
MVPTNQSCQEIPLNTFATNTCTNGVERRLWSEQEEESVEEEEIVGDKIVDQVLSSNSITSSQDINAMFDKVVEEEDGTTSSHAVIEAAKKHGKPPHVTQTSLRNQSSAKKQTKGVKQTQSNGKANTQKTQQYTMKGDLVHAHAREMEDATNTESEAKALLEAAKYFLSQYVYSFILETYSMPMKKILDREWKPP